MKRKLQEMVLKDLATMQKIKEIIDFCTHNKIKVTKKIAAIIFEKEPENIIKELISLYEENTEIFQKTYGSSLYEAICESGYFSLFEEYHNAINGTKNKIKKKKILKSLINSKKIGFHEQNQKEGLQAFKYLLMRYNTSSTIKVAKKAAKKHPNLIITLYVALSENKEKIKFKHAQEVLYLLKKGQQEQEHAASAYLKGMIAIGKICDHPEIEKILEINQLKK